MTESTAVALAPAPPPVLVDPATYDRSKKLGGSDIAAVIGKSPWRSRYDLWKDKTTPRIEQWPVTGVKRRGLRWEAVVGEMLVEALEAVGHKVVVLSTNHRYADPDHPFLAAEIDWELQLDDDPEPVNAELKTVHPFKMREWGEHGSDDCPVWYTAQVLHGLGVTRRKRGVLAALFGADELRAYPIMADAAVITWLREQAISFWHDHVLANVAPPPETIEDMLKAFPMDNATAPPLLADDDLAMKVMGLRAINAQLKSHEANADVVTLEIMRAMRDNPEIVMPNGKSAVEWKNRKGSWFDETALKEAHPKIYKEFLRTWEKRVFRVKPFETKGLL